MTQPNEFPPPDLLDYSGRLRRIVIALMVGIAAGVVAYVICDGLAHPDQMSGVYDGGSRNRAYKFVFYFTGVAAVVGTTGTLAILNYVAKRRARAESMPKAQIYKR